MAAPPVAACGRDPPPSVYSAGRRSATTSVVISCQLSGGVDMPTLIDSPTRIEAAGNKPKIIDEFIGCVRSGHERLSVAHMRSPAGWVEPGQTPEFDEYTVVLRGMLRVASR